MAINQTEKLAAIVAAHRERLATMLQSVTRGSLTIGQIYELVWVMAEEIARAEERGQLETFQLLLEKLQYIQRQTMITADKLSASSTALQAAVDAALLLIQPGTPASTPDSVVLAFQADVDAQTSRLAAAENSATPPAAPPAATA